MPRLNRRHFGALSLAALLRCPALVRADERLAGKACRSVHLGYPAAEAVEFGNEVVVEQSDRGTYFCVCGFSKGYYGLQELGNGKKLLIFSVWDPGAQDDPKLVDTDRRVKLIRKDPEVRTGRFGNEGTGGQSFLDFAWEAGKAYQFKVNASVEGDRSLYSAAFRPAGTDAWRELITFSTLAGGERLKGLYSFIEDFRRDRDSLTHERRARFGPAWAVGADGTRHDLTKARFTGDANPATNINAGFRDGAYFLATGGKVVNTDAKLNGTITWGAVQD